MVQHQMRGSKILMAAVGVASLALVSACGGSEEEVQYPPQQQNVQPTQPQPTAQPQPTTDPAPQPTTTAPAAPQPLDGASQTALEVAIDARAAKEAAGMKPVGAVFGGVLPTGGQTAGPQTMIDLGKCYTVIAQGGVGVTEVDIQIVAEVPIPGLQVPAVAVDNTTGPNAAISPCWKNAYPIGFPGKVILKATGGSGPVAGKLYVK